MRAPLRFSLAVLVAAAALVASGCGGPPRAAYAATGAIAEAVILADRILETRVTQAGEDARAQVRAEVARREILGETDEETVELGLARWEELMAPHTLARTVLRAARGAALTLDAILVAWDQGTRDEADFLGSAACAARVLVELVEALEAIEVEVPEILLDAIRFVSPFASGLCPAEVAS